jgi:hypothetical protein
LLQFGIDVDFGRAAFDGHPKLIIGMPDPPWSTSGSLIKSLMTAISLNPSFGSPL